jgi:hypothetical protein
VDNIDCLGNSISFNSRLNSKRGKENYYPPNGWIGIGLNVIGKYDEDNWLNDMSISSQWAIAYHPISSYLSLKNIVNEGLKAGDSQDKAKEEDIRNPRHLIGNGVYLYPEITVAEEKATSIKINNKKYKIVIMSKVMEQKIRQPSELNYWILDEKYIRPYRILFHEKISVTD